jgi:hypothetical protein
VASVRTAPDLVRGPRPKSTSFFRSLPGETFVLLNILPLLLLAVPTTATAADDPRLLEATPEIEVERPSSSRPAR